MTKANRDGIIGIGSVLKLRGLQAAGNLKLECSTCRRSPVGDSHLFGFAQGGLDPFPGKSSTGDPPLYSAS